MIGGETKGQLIFAIFEHTIPEKLIEPIWIIDYPEDVSPSQKSPHQTGLGRTIEDILRVRKSVMDGVSLLIPHSKTEV